MVRFFGLSMVLVIAVLLVGCGSQQSTSESGAKMELATGDAVDSMGDSATAPMVAARCDTVASDVERNKTLTMSQKEFLEKTLQHPDTAVQITTIAVFEAAAKYDESSRPYLKNLLKTQKESALPADKHLWDSVYGGLFPGEKLKTETETVTSSSREMSRPIEASEANEPAVPTSN